MSLLENIEEKRTEMLETAEKFGLSSEETLSCSQELDHLISEVQHWQT
ncbi:aspartyl-phosphate phosphatase Spo0E family protein [Thalassorhabdus alkalitolerans]|uniref:Aspartyl-phosphate phosphatase Spo0E family protein n=1 Tax=Thalassorhabdus alkalitolerans TaxID=2282697 RepID=A0ABW0YQ20_9BACI|nr:aspartyl-phosphate phosphatase Spo0E family protein [Bacillus sp. FJAT-44742]